MRSLQMALAIILLIGSLNVTAKEEPFNAVQELFKTMSNFDFDRMRQVTTDDFQLLEVGEVWDLEMLINAVKPKGEKYERRNYFNVIRTVQRGDTVWVSYWNKATFKVRENVQQVAWLESAVIIKENGVWKTQMLHSTRIKPEELPEGIDLKEYK